ncbi:uncharacterized protein K02A2.6-like [Ostrea edulis]|uniref:uncharacterized protein K02A2.6-like n=1 Tax=Ostrea edulis TaxID=37623 RepID=UPI0024AF51A6|nr:uncharacterized protein K02A2.6-like [Ostrea edulis]
MSNHEDNAATAPSIPVFVNPNIPIPGKLDLKGNLCTNWKKFKRIWSNYETASTLKEKDKEVRTATFLTCIGADALDIFDGLQFDSEDDKKDIDKVLEKFESFCIGQTNETYERYTFYKRDQEINENIDTYVAILRSLAKTCKFDALENDIIRDRIVLGIRDNGTRKKLLQEAKLDLRKCVDICRANEKSTSQLKTMEEVHAVKFKTMRKTKPLRTTQAHRKDFKQVPETKVQKECLYCGKEHLFRKELCPAWGKTCRKCNKMNHFSSKCLQTKPKSKREHVKQVNQESSDEEFILMIENVNAIEKKIFAEIEIGNDTVKFQLDCGSTVNVLPEKIYKEVCNDPYLRMLQKADMTLVMFNKSECQPLGKRRISVRNPKNNKKYNIEIVVVEGNLNPILGAKAVQGMKMITVNTENIAAIESASQSNFIIEKYSDVFNGLGKLDGKLHLDVDKSVTPVKLPTRKVPIAMKAPLKSEIDRLSDLGVLAPVTEPADWISSLVAVRKPSGKMRLCIDPKPLNKALKRNHYATPTIDDILPELSQARIFSVVDCKDGFWHITLDDESSFLTTFGTPWGRYRWLRMPFGIKPASEEFQRRMDEALSGIHGIKAIHDDIVVYGCGNSDDEAIRDHDKKLSTLLERCREKGIKINKDKMKLKLRSVSYLGHIISSDGLKVDPLKIKAITEMPRPKCKADIQRLLGMVNFVQKFAPNLSEITAPLRDLLKAESEFVWDNAVHGKTFDELKKLLSTSPILRFFDPNLPTTVQCDASERGLGACLIQNEQPVAYASRALTPTEVNYAQIEKELLAVLFAMERFEHYTLGRKVKVESDHKPLEIISKKSLVSAPKRLQRMLLRLQKFDYEITYKRGLEMYLADTLSRAYLPTVQIQRNDSEDRVLAITDRAKSEKDAESVTMSEYVTISSETLKKIKSANSRDETMQKLYKTIKDGWPERDELTPDIQIFYTFRDELTSQDGLIFKGDRIVIPPTLKGEILQKVHSSHIGIQGCYRRTKESLYWPNMMKDIESFIKECPVCATIQGEQGKETLISHEIPDRPWQKIGTDLFQFDDKQYLITVDYYSDFFEIDRLHDKKSKEVITKLKAQMARHGIPEILISDNGPPYNSKEFAYFSENYEFKHTTSSPLYPKSNGKVENAVRIAKNLMKKCQLDKSDPFLALLDWRNTPSENIGTSAVQRLMARRTRTLLPIKTELLKPALTPNVKERLRERKHRSAFYYNRTAKDLPEIKSGETVRIRPFGHEKNWTKAKVNEKVNIRSYQVITEDGRLYRRNRKHLRCTNEPFVENNEVVTDKTVSTAENTPPSADKTTIENHKPPSADKTNYALTSTRRSTREIKLPKRYEDFKMYK